MTRLTDRAWNADVAELKRLAARLRSVHALVHSTFRERDESAEAWAAWSTATREADRARRDFYDDDQPDTRVQAVRAGNRDAVEKAVRFLEVGPLLSLRLAVPLGCRGALRRHEPDRCRAAPTEKVAADFWPLSGIVLPLAGHAEGRSPRARPASRAERKGLELRHRPGPLNNARRTCSLRWKSRVTTG